MTAYQLIAPLGLFTLEAGASLTIEAINPDTGAAVTGVTVSAVTIYGENVYNAAAPVNRDPLFALEPLE